MTLDQATGELFHRLWQMRKSLHACMQQVDECCPRGQFFMLERLYYAIRQRGEGDAIPVSALAEQTRVLPTAVSRSLRQLEDAGLAERIHDPADHRRAFVRLTPAGEALRRRIEDTLRDYLDRVVHRMGAEDFAAMLELWRRWDEAMQAELPAAGR